MRREELFDILGQIDDRFIIPARRERRSIPWQNYVGVAAALCVIVTGVWFLVHMGSSGITLLPGNPTDPTSAITFPSDPTDESTEPTVSTETDPTGSTEPTLPVFDIDAWKQYSNQPETYRVIRGYDPKSEYDYPGKGFDRSQMVEGHWYILDDGQIIPMAVQFSVWHVSSEYLYYTLPGEPRTVYRSDLHMEEITVIYESEYGDIGYIQFSGFDANGQLVLLEGGNRIIFYDIPTGEVEVVLEASEITNVYSYSPVDNWQDWKSEIYNPIISWHGSLKGELYSDCVYYLEAGINMGSSGITLLPGNPTDPTSAITAPSTDPTQPSETTVPTTLPQETQPYYSELMVFLYEGKQPFQSVTVDVSQCQLDHLYYYYEKSGEVVPICDEPVACYGDNPSGFYFVKKAEPNKIYSAPLTNLAEQFVLYTSDFGPVCEIYAGDIGADANVLMLTVDNKRGVLLDLASGETEVFIQQYYIEDTIIGDLLKTDGKWTYNKIWFRGKLNEEDTLKDYFYWIDSDSITENNN